MFSRDNKHYKPTPRSTQEAFGPYHEYHHDESSRWDIVWNMVSIFCALMLAAFMGVMIGWGV